MGIHERLIISLYYPALPASAINAQNVLSLQLVAGPDATVAFDALRQVRPDIRMAPVLLMVCHRMRISYHAGFRVLPPRSETLSEASRAQDGACQADILKERVPGYCVSAS